MSEQCYANRSHRQKYKLGYGAEGAAKGKDVLPLDSSDNPAPDEKEESANQKPQQSKKRPNPY